MEKLYAIAIVLSNVLTITVVLWALWFARSGYLREQKKVLGAVDEVRTEIRRWDDWRIDHEKWADGKAAMLAKAYDSTLTQAAQIAALDRTLVRWEERYIDVLKEKK